MHRPTHTFLCYVSSLNFKVAPKVKALPVASCLQSSNKLWDKYISMYTYTVVYVCVCINNGLTHCCNVTLY